MSVQPAPSSLNVSRTPSPIEHKEDAPVLAANILVQPPVEAGAEPAVEGAAFNMSAHVSASSLAPSPRFALTVPLPEEAIGQFDSELITQTPDPLAQANSRATTPEPSRRASTPIPSEQEFSLATSGVPPLSPAVEEASHASVAGSNPSESPGLRKEITPPSSSQLEEPQPVEPTPKGKLSQEELEEMPASPDANAASSAQSKVEAEQKEELAPASPKSESRKQSDATTQADLEQPASLEQTDAVEEQASLPPKSDDEKHQDAATQVNLNQLPASDKTDDVLGQEASEDSKPGTPAPAADHEKRTPPPFVKTKSPTPPLSAKEQANANMDNVIIHPSADPQEELQDIKIDGAKDAIPPEGNPDAAAANVKPQENKEDESVHLNLEPNEQEEEVAPGFCKRFYLFLCGNKKQ